MCLSDARLSRVARRLYLFCCWTGSELVFGKRFHRRSVSSESYVCISCVLLAFFFVCKVFCSLSSSHASLEVEVDRAHATT